MRWSGWIAGLTCAAACAVTAPAAGPAQPAMGAAEIEKLVAESKVDAAIAAGREAVRLRPEDPDLHMALAQALSAKGRKVQRVVDAEVDTAGVAAGKEALPVPSPENARLDAVYDPALLQEALAEVRQAIRLAPKRKDLRLSECFLLTDAGEIKKAAAAIYRVTESFPGEPGLAPTLASYGSERAKRGDLEGAATLLGVVVTAYPGAAAPQVENASVLARLGRRDEALAALDRAGKAATAGADLERKRAVVAILLQDFRRAREAFLAAHRTSRQDADRLAAAAAAFGADPSSASYDLEELALPAASGDRAAAQLADAFLRAVPPGVGPRMELVQLLVSKNQELLAVPVLHRVLLEQPGHAEATAKLDGIYRKVQYPRPR